MGKEDLEKLFGVDGLSERRAATQRGSLERLTKDLIARLIEAEWDNSLLADEAREQICKSVANFHAHFFAVDDKCRLEDAAMRVAIAALRYVRDVCGERPGR